jgi:hypothetical protein
VAYLQKEDKPFFTAFLQQKNSKIKRIALIGIFNHM